MRFDVVELRLPVSLVTEAILESPRVEGDIGPDQLKPRVEVDLGLSEIRQQLFDAAGEGARERFEELLELFVQWSLLKQAGIRVVPPMIEAAGMSQDIDLRSLLSSAARHKTSAE